MQEKDHWKQRAKVFWLKEGDLNTKFFYASANSRRKTNQISRLQDEDGNWFSDQQDLGRIAVNYFNDFLSYCSGVYDPIFYMVFPVISAEDNNLLLAPFTLDESRYLKYMLINLPARMVLIRYFFRNVIMFWALMYLIPVLIGFNRLLFHWA